MGVCLCLQATPSVQKRKEVVDRNKDRTFVGFDKTPIQILVDLRFKTKQKYIEFFWVKSKDYSLVKWKNARLL